MMGDEGLFGDWVYGMGEVCWDYGGCMSCTF